MINEYIIKKALKNNYYMFNKSYLLLYLIKEIIIGNYKDIIKC